MKKINLMATRIFCVLLQKIGNADHVKLQSGGYMPLNIERLQENILTPWGVGTTYSVLHSYIQNGDLMRDPEMVFLVIDNRKKENDFTSISIFPQSYQQDNLSLYEESMSIQNGQVKSFIKIWQYSHCLFANQWLKNIKEQGFLK